MTRPTRPQTWQIVNQEPLEVLETGQREPMHNLNSILDSKLDFPFRILLQGSNLVIRGSEFQSIKSDGVGGFENSFKVAASPIQGRYKQIPTSTLNFSGGTASSEFDSPSLGQCPNMPPDGYVWLAIELRRDGKFHSLWGTPSIILNAATYPIFSSGDAICLVLLRDNGTGGQWNFNTPLPEEIILFKESNQLEIREDAVHSTDYIDIVRTSLPTSPTPIVDGQTVGDDQVVLFTQQPIEGLYRFNAAGASTTDRWEKLLNPKDGANVQVFSGNTAYFKTIWKRIDSIWRPIEVADAVKEPSGFPNRTDSTFSFDDTTRTFSIEPSASGLGRFDFFEKGKVYRRDSQDSVTIDDEEGSWFIYYKDGVLTASHNFTEYIISDYAYVSNLYWDSTNKKHIFMGDERHGITMDGATHKYLHLSVGTVLQSGLSISSFNTSGSGSASGDATFALSDGRLFDEDIDMSITHNDTPSAIPQTEEFHQQILYPVARIPAYWREGPDGDFRRDLTTDFAVKQGTARIQWNKLDGGNWTTVDATSDNYFVTTWIFATNSVTEPVVAILGQAEYDNLTEAQEKEQFSFLNLGDFPVEEFKLCYRMIWETSSGYTNGPKCRLADIQDLRVSPDAPFPSVSPNDHGLLSGLSDPDHPPTAVTTQGVALDGGLSSADIDAENVFSTLNSLLGQLRLKEHPTNKKRVKITGADRLLNSGTLLGQELNSLLVSFDGAEIDFIDGSIYANDGTTPLGINFTPVALNPGQYHWYSINLVGSSVNTNATINTQVLVIPAGNGGATQDSAPRAPFANGTKIGQVVVHDNGAGGTGTINDITENNLVQLGTGSGSGSGSGDANELLERLKNRLDLNTYEYVTPNIFSNVGADLTDEINTTASFSVVEQSFNFENIGDEFRSLNNIDPSFLDETDDNLQDIKEVELINYYKLDAFDESASVFVSRDGGLNWQQVNMSRIGSSDTYRGFHRFTQEPTYQFNEIIGGTANSVFTFNGSNRAERNFSFFTLPSTTLLQRVTANVTVVGNPKGYIQAKYVLDNGLGQASTDPADVITFSSLVKLDGITSGNLDIDLEYPVSSTTGYHLVLETDGAYANEYAISGGSNRIEIPNNTLQQGVVLTLRGRALDLRVRIVGGTEDSLLAGYGIFYKKETVIENQSGIVSQQKFIFDGLVDNLNEFDLNFTPTDKNLKCYEQGTGSVYTYGDFLLEGNKVIFPPNTFSKTGTIRLTFEQSLGSVSSFDNSDDNRALLLANHLGSIDPNLDFSANGRGIYLRSADGTLREVIVDNAGNVTSVIA